MREVALIELENGGSDSGGFFDGALSAPEDKVFEMGTMGIYCLGAVVVCCEISEIAVSQGDEVIRALRGLVPEFIQDVTRPTGFYRRAEIRGRGLGRCGEIGWFCGM